MGLMDPKKFEQMEPYMKAAEEQRVVGLDVISLGEFLTPEQMTKLSLAELKALLYSPQQLFFKGTGYTEGIRRFSGFVEHLNLINEGKMVPADTWLARSMKGLTETEAGAKYVAWETVDYARLTDLQKVTRNLLAPFCTWHMWITHTRLRKTGMLLDPRVPLKQKASGAKGLVYAAMPYFLATIWNWMMYPEIEDKMSPYRRSGFHVISGKKDPYTGDPYIWSLGLPLEVQMNMMGLKGMLGIPSRYFASKIAAIREGHPEHAKPLLRCIEEWYVEEFAEGKWLRGVTGLQGPLSNTVLGTFAGKDLKTRRPIVPSGVNNEQEAQKHYYRWLAQNWLPPLNAYMADVRTGDIPRDPGKLLPQDARGFLDNIGLRELHHTFGIYQEDVNRGILQHAARATREAEGIQNKRLNELERAYATYVIDQTPEKLADYDKVLTRILTEKNTTVDLDVIGRRFKSPSFLHRLTQMQYDAISPADRAEKGKAARRLRAAEIVHNMFKAKPTTAQYPYWKERFDKYHDDQDVTDLLWYFLSLEDGGMEEELAKRGEGRSSVDTGQHLIPYVEDLANAVPEGG
jgi:hypothetical protein